MATSIKTVREKVKPIEANTACSVYVTNRVIEIIATDKECISPSYKVKRLNHKEYLSLATGEVKEYRNALPRVWNTNGLRKSFVNLRRLINNNITGDDSERHIVLCYSLRMRDYEKANTDFKAFWEKFKYRNPSCEYIRIIEPQKSGSWHIHVLMKDTGNRHFKIRTEEIESLWPHGSVWIERLPFTDNYGAYFSACLTNMDLDESEDRPLAPVNRKRIDKHARLKFYPPKFRLYNASKGIKRPEKLRMTYAEALKLLGDRELCYAYRDCIIQYENESGIEREVNAITYEQYKQNEKALNTVQAEPNINN